MAYSLDVSGLNELTTYTDENKMELVRASLLSGKTLSMITVQPGIKSSAQINMLSSTPSWVAGECGFDGAGSTELTQREIKVSSIKKNEAICLNTLEAIYTQTMMKAGSYNEELPFAQLYAEELAAQTSKFVETLAWKGSIAGGDLADGLMVHINAAIVAGDASAALTGAIAASDIVATVDAMVISTPMDAIESEDLVLFMGLDMYRVYTKALRDANLFNYSDFSEGANFEIVHPGTNVKVVGVGGLNGGNNSMVLAEASNLFAGTDLLEDAEAFRIFYSQDNDEVRVIQKMKIGFQVAFPGRLVVNIPA